MHTLDIPTPSQSFDPLFPASLITPLLITSPLQLFAFHAVLHVFFQCCLAPESSQSLFLFPLSRSLHTAASVIDIPLGEAS